MKMIYPQSHHLSRLPLRFCLHLGGGKEPTETQSLSTPSIAHARFNWKYSWGWRKIKPTRRKEEESSADDGVEEIRKKTGGTTRK